MSAELERFLQLFDALVVASNAWIEQTPDDKLDWVPFDNPSMKFGDRVSTITIRSLYVHTLTGEKMWARMLSDCGPGDQFRPEPETELTSRLMSSASLVGDAMTIHRENLDVFAAFSDARLETPIQWVGRDWTVMGFLWGIYSHRSYHLGNIDLYLREAAAAAPDFFSTFRQTLA